MTFLELSEDSREPGLSNICPEGVQTGEYKYYFSVFTFHFSHQDSSLPQHLPHHSRGSGALPGGLQTSPLQKCKYFYINSFLKQIANLDKNLNQSQMNNTYKKEIFIAIVKP